MATLDTRTALAFTLPDAAVTIAGNGGGASVDLSSAAALGGLLAANGLGDVVGASVSLGNYANDAAAATGGVAIGALYRNGSILMVRVA